MGLNSKNFGAVAIAASQAAQNPRGVFEGMFGGPRQRQDPQAGPGAPAVATPLRATGLPTAYARSPVPGKPTTQPVRQPAPVGASVAASPLQYPITPARRSLMVGAAMAAATRARGY